MERQKLLDEHTEVLTEIARPSTRFSPPTPTFLHGRARRPLLEVKRRSTATPVAAEIIMDLRGAAASTWKT